MCTLLWLGAERGLWHGNSHSPLRGRHVSCRYVPCNECTAAAEKLSSHFRVQFPTLWGPDACMSYVWAITLTSDCIQTRVSALQLSQADDPSHWEAPFC